MPSRGDVISGMVGADTHFGLEKVSPSRASERIAGRAMFPPERPSFGGSALHVNAISDCRSDELTNLVAHVHMNIVHANQLQTALENLSEAIRAVEMVLKMMHAEHDPLAVHIFLSRRQYRNVPDTKSGKRSDVAARLSWQAACDLGFRGSLGEWGRLMGAACKR